MISIVTCIYDQDTDLFRKCVSSVAIQEGQFEWWIVDDGSKAQAVRGYFEVLSEFPTLTDKVTFKSLPCNRGLSIARNHALRECQGEWVIILDSDDELPVAAIQEITSLDESARIVCFASEFLKADGAVELRSVHHWEKLFREYALTPADPFLWFDFYYHGMVARRETIEGIGGYLEHIPVGEDQDVLLRGCERVGSGGVRFIDRVGYRYRENPSGVCKMRWNEVEANYALTMTDAARRRGADFKACRCIGTRLIDGAEIDEYTYQQGEEWLRWEDVIK